VSSEEESHKESLEDNQIQNDDLFEEDLDSSSQINVLTKEQDLIFEAINSITNP
jgi:poly(A) polymerase Pap1